MQSAATVSTRRFRLSSQARAACFFMLPSLLILFLFVIVPIFQAGWIGLHDWRLGRPNPEFIGLENYIELLEDDRFWNALKNTAVYTLGVVPARIIIALFFALLLKRKLRGVALFRAMLFLPAVISFAIEAIIWRFMLDPDIGLLPYATGLIGITSPEWLRSTTWAMPAVIIVSIWRWFGFNMVILLAGLQGIPDTYYEAAEVDGANAWQQFWKITLPLLRPAVLFVLVEAIITSLQVFDQVYVLTGGGPLFSTETLVAYVYHQGFEIFDLGYASAAAYVLFFLIFFLTLGQLRLLHYRGAY
jgi:multiple sugar transport system permease protein